MTLHPHDRTGDIIMTYTVPTHDANRITDEDGTRAYNAAEHYWNDTPTSRRNNPDPTQNETALRLAASAIGCGLHDLRASELIVLAGITEAARTADNLYEDDGYWRAHADDYHDGFTRHE